MDLRNKGLRAPNMLQHLCAQGCIEARRGKVDPLPLGHHIHEGAWVGVHSHVFLHPVPEKGPIGLITAADIHEPDSAWAEVKGELPDRR